MAIGASEALERLQAGNAAYVQARANTGDISPERVRELSENGQAPYACVVSCADSRVVPEHIFMTGLGEIFTIRVAGNVIGDMELDQSLTSRDTINGKMRAILDEATDPWGIKVNRVEIKNIIPPEEIQTAMERQMKAERERRASILQAEGQKESQIRIAEGEKQAAILKADGEKESAIRRAEGEKQARILAAEAESQAIGQVQAALADSLKLLNAAAPNEQVVKLKALEAMQKVADGKATKIIIPSGMQGLAGLAAGVRAVWDEGETDS